MKELMQVICGLRGSFRMRTSGSLPLPAGIVLDVVEDDEIIYLSHDIDKKVMSNDRKAFKKDLIVAIKEAKEKVQDNG